MSYSLITLEVANPDSYINMLLTAKSKAFSFGILASLFFASTFVLNRIMAVSGGGWQWSSALRFVWMLPILLLIVIIRGDLKQLLIEMKKKSRAMVALEYTWIWNFLCSVDIWGKLWSFLVSCSNL